MVGYPERFAQMAWGHNSKAVHRAYAKKAQVTLPPLEDYEREHAQKVVPLIAAAVQQLASAAQLHGLTTRKKRDVDCMPAVTV